MFISREPKGLTVGEGDLVIFTSLATVDAASMKVLYKFVDNDLTAEEMNAISGEINLKVALSNAVFEFKCIAASRGILVVRGMHSKLRAQISNTDSGARTGSFVVESKPLAGYENSKEAVESATLINEFTKKAHIVLNEASFNKARIAGNNSPVNMILCYIPQAV